MSLMHDQPKRRADLLQPRYWSWYLEGLPSPEDRHTAANRHTEALLKLGYFARREFATSVPWDSFPFGDGVEWLRNLGTKATQDFWDGGADWPTIVYERSSSNTVLISIVAPVQLVQGWDRTIREHEKGGAMGEPSFSLPVGTRTGMHAATPPSGVPTADKPFDITGAGPEVFQAHLGKTVTLCGRLEQGMQGACLHGATATNVVFYLIPESPSKGTFTYPAAWTPLFHQKVRVTGDLRFRSVDRTGKNQFLQFPSDYYYMELPKVAIAIERATNGGLAEQPKHGILRDKK